MLGEVTGHAPNPRRAGPHPRPSPGFTVIELLVTLTVVSVLAAMAVPAMVEFVVKRRVRGVADELMVDLRLARSLQMTHNLPIAVKFSANAAMSCYTVVEYYALASCDCLNTSGPVCTSPSAVTPAEYKTVRLPLSSGVTVAPEAGSATEVLLDATSGMPQSAAQFSIAVSAAAGGTARVQTNAAFRPSACSVAGHESAYPVCGP